MIIVHKLFTLLMLFLVADYTLTLPGNSVTGTQPITLNAGETLMVKIEQSGAVFVEVLLDGKQVFNNTLHGSYADVNLTLNESGKYTISLRNTKYSSEKVTYSIMITGKSYSRSIILS
jgi:hypothetical protein